jgi:hypothetical protein
MQQLFRQQWRANLMRCLMVQFELTIRTRTDTQTL